MLSKTFVLVAGATSAYAACSLTPGAGTVQLAANSIVSPDGTDSRTPTKGVPFTVMYDGTGLGPTLDFVLLKGPGNNIIAQGYVATGVQNCGTATCTFSWTPECSLQDTAGAYNGYGIRMDDESTCKYQYTTQFGLKAGTVCGATPSSSSAAPPASSSASSAPSASSKHPTSSPPPHSSFATSVAYPTGSHGKPSSGSTGPAPSSVSHPVDGSYPADGSSTGGSSTGGSSAGGYGSSGSWSPPSNGTAYQPPNVAGGSSNPTYTPVQSNNAAGRFTVNAVGALVALAVSAMLL